MRILITAELRMDRLTRLRDVMIEVSKKPKLAFKHSTFGRVFSSVEQMYEYILPTDRSDLPPCHTQACIAGWAGLTPSFQAEGLLLDDIGMHVGEEPAGPYSLAEFFGITTQECKALFYGMTRVKCTEPRYKDTNCFVDKEKWFDRPEQAVDAINKLIEVYEIKPEVTPSN